MGVEPEVYVLRETDAGVRPWIGEDTANLPTRGYDLETTMLADPFLEPMVSYINELGWDVYSFDHEGGDGQYEFDFGFTDGGAHTGLFRLLHAQAVPGRLRVGRPPEREPGRHRHRPERI